MKKICEIYDVSQEYKMKENSLLVCISDISEQELYDLLPELKIHFDNVFDNYEWKQFLEINKEFYRNESKHNMRNIRQSKKLEADVLSDYEMDAISEIICSSELKSKMDYALSMLSPVPKRRFLKHYYEGLTYREIAKEENKAVSTIYESVMTARKKFLKYFQ